MIINGPRKLLTRAVFAARVLDVWNFELEVRFAQKDSNSSTCSIYDRGNFLIEIQNNLPKYWLIHHVAHEMTHLRQYKTGKLRDADGFNRFWNGEFHRGYDYPSDEYFLHPWEIEARAMEAFVAYKWERRNLELH